MNDPSFILRISFRYLGGKRQCSTYLYEYLKYPTNLISPINLLWDQNNRNILIWIHPSAFNDAFREFNYAIEIMNLNNAIFIQDYNNLLMFEFTGPRTTALLQAVLDVVDDNNERDNDKGNDLKDDNMKHNNNKDSKDIKDENGDGGVKFHINTDAHKVIYVCNVFCIHLTIDIRASISIYSFLSLFIYIFYMI